MDKKDLFKHYYNEFKTIAKQIKSQDWFTPKWKISTNLNERDQPYLTLQKTDWPDGIHFESWITGADLDRKTIPLAFHFEAPFEETGIKRGEFYQYVLEHGQNELQKLEGYKLSPKSFQLLIKRAPFLNDDPSEIMLYEYNKLQTLGTVIDNALHSLSA